MPVTVLVARTILALFASSVLAVGAYFLSLVFFLPMIAGLRQVGPSAFQLLGYSIPTVSASIGAFLPWIDQDMPFQHNLLVFVLAMLAAILGGWVGLQYGETVRHERWEMGSPELMNFIRGAVIGSNLPPLAFGLMKTLRRHP